MLRTSQIDGSSSMTRIFQPAAVAAAMVRIVAGASAPSTVRFGDVGPPPRSSRSDTCNLQINSYNIPVRERGAHERAPAERLRLASGRAGAGPPLPPRLDLPEAPP